LELGKREPKDERVMWTRGAKSEQKEQMAALAGEGEKTTLIGGKPNILLLMLATNELRGFFLTYGSSFLCVSSYINRAAPL